MKNINNNQINNDESSNKKEGLPEISNKNNYEPKTLIIIGIIISVCLYGWAHMHSNSNTSNKDGNESFRIDDQSAPTLKANLSPQPKNQTNLPPENNMTLATSPDEQNDIQKAVLARLQAPIMVSSDQNTANVAPDSSSSSNNDSKSTDPNTEYLNQTSDEQVETSSASILKNRNTLIAQGNLIHAILESSINSDLPGYLRAIVSEPVYSEDGTQILITAGSRLIGQYKSGMQTGQSRVFIVWTRIIEPNGVSIQIGSPDVDSLGESGQNADKIDYHFWQMFGTATMLSILGAGASNVGVSSTDQYNAAQAYRESVAQSLAQSAQSSLSQNTSIPPTLHINQGTPVIVFVTKDLRFDKAPLNSGMNIFA